MKIFVVIAALATIANAGLAPIVIIPSAATTLLRSPALDSAVVQSERLGGNFAYAIAEGQQFQSVAPIALRSPLGVSYAYNSLPLWSPLAGPRIIIDQQLDQSLRDEAQKEWDRQLEAHDQVVQAHRQLQQNQEDLIREQVGKQLEQQQLIIQQQEVLNAQAVTAVQQAEAVQQSEVAATSAPAVEAAPVVSDDSVVVESAEARSETA